MLPLNLVIFPLSNNKLLASNIPASALGIAAHMPPAVISFMGAQKVGKSDTINHLFPGANVVVGPNNPLAATTLGASLVHTVDNDLDLFVLDLEGDFSTRPQSSTYHKLFSLINR